MAGICLDCSGRKVGQKRRYRPDFYIPEFDFYIELKGAFSSRDRTKMLAVRKANPDIDFRILLLADNKINKNSEKRYSDWCNEHEWVWYLGRNPPDKWFSHDYEE